MPWIQLFSWKINATWMMLDHVTMLDHDDLCSGFWPNRSWRSESNITKQLVVSYCNFFKSEYITKYQRKHPQAQTPIENLLGHISLAPPELSHHSNCKALRNLQTSLQRMNGFPASPFIKLQSDLMIPKQPTSMVVTSYDQNSQKILSSI